VCCYHLSSLLFVLSISRVVFLKYTALKERTLFSVHTILKTNFFLIRPTAFTVGYFGPVPFQVVLAIPVLHSLFCYFFLYVPIFRVTIRVTNFIEIFPANFFNKYFYRV
jgi:hypothetical protein